MALMHQATEKAPFGWSALFLTQESIYAVNLLNTTSSFFVIRELVVSLSVHLWEKKKKALEMCCVKGFYSVIYVRIQLNNDNMLLKAITYLLQKNE